jgi:IS5 family transposase
MKQVSLGESGFERKTKRTRKREFLDEMNLVVPWVELIAPHAPARGARRLPSRPCCTFTSSSSYSTSRTRPWKRLHAMALFRIRGPGCRGRQPARRERHPAVPSLLDAHNLSLQILATVNATLAAKGSLLKSGTVVDATLIAAPSSTRNSSGGRDPEMHQTKNGNSGTSG